ncbi:MAG: cell division protein FtsL [Nitrospirae bacterium]|nr:cell division protein FtsL [Nitrospirota bacterium]
MGLFKSQRVKGSESRRLRASENDESRGFQAMIIVGLILFIAITYVWQRVMIVELGYEIERLRQQRTELSRKNAELLTEVSSLSSLPRIEKIALSNLNMKRPEKGSVIIVRDIRPAPVMIGETESSPLQQASSIDLRGEDKS